MNPKYPESIIKLIGFLKKLPGVGTKTAERFAFDLIRWKENEMKNFSTAIGEISLKIIPCTTCGAFTQEGVCHFCNLSQRDPSILCIVSSPKEIYAIEETGTFKGLYHVIEHLLSPLDGRHAATLRIDRIIERIQKNHIKEIVLAFDSTIDADTTALYIKQQLTEYPVSISRLAYGLPIGSYLDSIDGSTLLRALADRRQI